MRKTRHLLFKLMLVIAVIGAGYLVYLDARITSTFDDKMWELPAKVYARPLELFAGAQLSPDDLAYELEVLGYRKVSAASSPGQVARNRGRFDIYTRGFDFPGEREPSRLVRVELGSNRIQGIRADSRSVDLMRLDPVQIGGIYPTHGEDRILVRYGAVCWRWRTRASTSTGVFPLPELPAPPTATLCPAGSSPAAAPSPSSWSRTITSPLSALWFAS